MKENNTVRACSVSGCDKAHHARGLCQGHYLRLKRHGNVGSPSLRKWSREVAVCYVSGCDRTVRAKGLCGAHYLRVQKHGDIGDLKIGERVYVECAVEECSRTAKARGYCGMHYQRFRKHGDPRLVISQPNGESSPLWSGSDITYTGAHIRVRRIRGSASDHTCVSCGSQALHWAYNHSDPDEKVSPDGRKYSQDPNYYQPMCVPCHSRFDDDYRHAT